MKNYVIPVFVFLVAGIFLAGCVGPSATAPVTPAAPVTSVPTPQAATTVSTVPASTLMDVPAQVVTVVHQVSSTKDVRDSELLFTLQVPVEWNVKTYQLKTADNSEVLEYQTDIVKDDIFYIRTYTVSRSQDQVYRDGFRKWSPAPAETTVTINGIVYDRFESSFDGRTHVAYVARKGSANERGYASVIVFAADPTDRFQKEDYERIVRSFRYIGESAAATMTGEEIPRVALPYKPSGSFN